MKRTILFIAALALYLFASAPVNAANANKLESLYVISEVEHLHLGNNIEKVWTLSYSKQESPVTITLYESNHGKKYVVRSKFFEVLYASDKSGFGVRKMHHSMKQVPVDINSKVLNQKEMENQQILKTGVLTDDDALNLIASYLPNLLNKDYNHLIY